MAGPQDTTGRLPQVTRRQFTAAVGLGLTAAGVSFAVADRASGRSTPPVRPAVKTRPAPSATPVPSATPSPAPPEGPLIDPFTGKPVKALRPVLAVKIDNIVYARPQTGLRSADIIYVIPVEGGLTRFMAVYSSHLPPVVGPVRSARQSDLDLLSQFGRPAFAWSGATPHLVPFIERAPVVDLYALTAGGYFRSANRIAPYNLYADTRQLLAEAKGASKARDIGFRFGAAPAGGTPAASCSVKYPTASCTFRWSAQDRRWLLWMDGAPAMATEGGQLGGSTVIVQYTQIATSRFEEYGGRPPYAKSIGSGNAVVLRDGRAYSAFWSRPNRETGTTYTLWDSQPMLFAPGQTWVVLAPDSHASYLNAARV
ncbi:MAG TPA: DUF3048 domain-containing protein [Streptosporangiaceae bacterium]|nr:DUF3048 domain-containing protein [Streptosporangiaceae bacterium]